VISEQNHRLFAAACESATTFVVTTHMNPDADAIGSQVGIVRYLASLGKQMRVVNNDPTPEMLRFLEDPAHPAEAYRAGDHDALLRSVDRIVLVDNSAPDRLGAMESIMAEVAGKVLCIDHHPTRETPWADLILSPRACATAAMLYELLERAGWQADPLAAQGLYAGLATDTGFFRFNSTDARAHEIAAALHRLGADPPSVYQGIYERNSLSYTRLLGHALAGVRVERDVVAIVVIDRDLVEHLAADDVDSSEVMTALLAMDGIEIALLFRELEGGRVKVSLRSKGERDVHSLASEFGGGGHRNASGIVMDGSLDDTVRKVTERAGKLLES
jgi:phosphoesterase RecJ-like protein